jgi:hypothetical protein
MQTWRSEYKGAAAPAPAAAAPVAKATAVSARDAVKGPAKLEFQETTSKWQIENQTAEAGVIKVHRQ